MLSLVSFPPDRQEIERWFADHPRQWGAGHAYRLPKLQLKAPEPSPHSAKVTSPFFYPPPENYGRTFNMRRHRT